jgi:nucleotide-binding universal stress UspA family protein
MDAFRNLLVPVYFDETSTAAFTYAAYFARRHGGKVFLLHVVPTDELHLLREVYRPVEGGGANEEHAAKVAKERLEAIAREQLSGIDTEIVLHHSADPVRGILAEQERCSADLVIMATHARSGFARLVVRNVAERVARESLRPVLVTQRKADVDVDRPFQKILCPIDLDRLHESSLEYARTLALENDGTVHLLHVIPTTEIFLSRPVYKQEPGNPGDYVRAESASREELEKIAREKLGGVKSEIHVHVSPEPAKAILNVERDLKPDLMIMVTQGLTGVIHLIVGSVTERMIRKGYCPVLSVHA